MYIVVIAWVYVVLMMALSNAMERSVLSGIMTFLIYCVLPLGLILYIAGSPRRKKQRDEAYRDAHLRRQQLERDNDARLHEQD